MVFADPLFLFVFLPLVLAGFFACRVSARNALLVVASLLFYAWGDPVDLCYLCAIILFNYALGLLLGRASPHRARLLVITGITINLFGLGMLKYADFAARILSSLLPVHLAWQAHLPLGISFFTFHALSYLIDVYRREQAPQRSLVQFALYLSLFPQLLAGPILRYGIFAPQLDTPRRVSLADLEIGLRRFVVGLGKKILFADQLAPFADAAFAVTPTGLTPGIAWIGILAYTFQIYFDFSGYSDMAIGLARIVGFHFPENFRWPYVASSVSDFWRRWHISLMEWFRAYVYIPLGGSRGSLPHTCRNLLVVFALSGLWHGAGWHFVAWGMYFGVLLCCERCLGADRMKRIPRALGIPMTFLLVVIGWVLFRSPTVAFALRYLLILFGFSAGSDSVAMTPFFLQWSDALPFLIIGALAATPLSVVLHDLFQQHQRAGSRCRAVLPDLAYIFLFLLALSGIVTATFRPFLYFQF